MQKRAVILFSGGLDSTTCVAIAKSKGFLCYLLSIDYKQKHRSELNAATLLASKLNVVEHKIVTIDLNTRSALTDENCQIPNFQVTNQIPVTYVPARNTIFLSIALGWAEMLGAFHIFIGANEQDYSGYPDCRPDYLKAFENVANLATKAGREGSSFFIEAPLLKLRKFEIIQKGIELGVDYGMTISCYRAGQSGLACGECDSCTYRKKGFKEAGIQDPTHYI